MTTSAKLIKACRDLKRRRQIRRINGKLLLTQRCVAESIGCSVSTLQRFESQDYLNMPLGHFLKMLKLLEENGINTDI
jgi:DNA-binding transcriptional regulator YiaG